MKNINLPNLLVIIVVFMVSMLTACATHSGEVLTFANIAKDIEANPERARRNYEGRIVKIRAKAETFESLRAQLVRDSYYSAHLSGDSGLVGSRFVSFWVTDRSEARSQEPFRPDKFFHPDGESDDSYLFKVRIKSIDPNAAPHYWTVWTEILEYKTSAFPW